MVGLLEEDAARGKGQFVEFLPEEDAGLGPTLGNELDVAPGSVEGRDSLPVDDEGIGERGFEVGPFPSPDEGARKRRKGLFDRPFRIKGGDGTSAREGDVTVGPVVDVIDVIGRLPEGDPAPDGAFVLGEVGNDRPDGPVQVEAIFPDRQLEVAMAVVSFVDADHRGRDLRPFFRRRVASRRVGSRFRGGDARFFRGRRTFFRGGGKGRAPRGRRQRGRGKRLAAGSEAEQSGQGQDG